MSQLNLQKIMAAAMDNASEGICISDPFLPDNPLIYVNKGFLRLTGYSYEEIIGKNARFLQGQGTDIDTLRQVREAIKNEEPIQIEILNYKKDGTPFWNKMSITPIFDHDKRLTHFIGVQEDITALKEKQLVELRAERQRIIAEVALETQEKERITLGKELHDNINQILTTVKLYLNLAIESEGIRMEMLNKSVQVLSKAMEEIRKLSKLLVGPSLNEFTLKESLSDLIDTMKLVAPFTIYYNDNKLEEEELSDARKVMLFRVIQEQLNNIIKHAKATEVSIVFYKKDDVNFVVIRDNGVGFSKNQLKNGIGLRNMISRLEMESCKMRIHTEPGKGCEVVIEIPAFDLKKTG